MSYTTEYWRALLEEEAADLPTERLLAWIAEESGGNPAALGAVYEVGIFQLDMQDGSKWGASIQTLHGNFTSSSTSQSPTRPLTPDEERLQVTSGAAYVRYALGRAQQELDAIGASWSDSDLWCLVKLQHGLPGIPYYMLPSAGDAASSWDTWRDYVLSQSAVDVGAINANLSRYTAKFARIFANAERVGRAQGNVIDEVAGSIDVELLVMLAAAAWLLFYFI